MISWHQTQAPTVMDSSQDSSAQWFYYTSTSVDVIFLLFMVNIFIIPINKIKEEKGVDILKA